jgi:diacylglycerol kinase family enzyme
MLVILNPAAGGGKALRKWNRIHDLVRQRIGPFDLLVTHECEVLRWRLARALLAGERRFVAAGGDGTANLLLELLTELAPDGLSEMTLGAIGLGSSNDLHKPFEPANLIGGIPVRLDFVHPVRHDIGRTTYYDEMDRVRVRHWLINASIGATAEGNRIYNEDSGFIAWLKRRSTGFAMATAACKALLRYSERTMVVIAGGGTRELRHVRNLGVVKNPHFAGSLRYDSPYEPGSGDFQVHLLADTTWLGMLAALLGLLGGRFRGRRGARSWRARRLTLLGWEPFAVEADGEIAVTRMATFDLQPQALQVCT